jgi:transcriptional regulator with XRE-family HTH domain
MKGSDIMQNRLKALRSALELTQSDFATKLNLSRSIVATYESGRAPVSDRTIADICREFNVREEWLRNGTGPMFQVPQNTNTELANEIGKLLRSDDEFTKELFLRYLKLPPAFKRQFEDFLYSLVEAVHRKEEK